MHSKREFRFRLNGIIIPQIRVQRAQLNEEPVGGLQIAVEDSWIGWFSIDDNSRLPDPHLSRFVLEYRDETAWNQTDPLLRRLDRSQGWQTVSSRRLMQILQRAGIINVDELREG